MPERECSHLHAPTPNDCVRRDECIYHYYQPCPYIHPEMQENPHTLYEDYGDEEYPSVEEAQRVFESHRTHP